MNEINWAIAADPPSRRPSGWGKIAERLPIKRLHSVERDTPVQPMPLTPGQTAQLGSSQFKLLSTAPLLAELHLPTQKWTWLGTLSPQTLSPQTVSPQTVSPQKASLLQSGLLSKTQVLVWSGQRLEPDIVRALQPQVAIATSRINSQTEALLKQLGTRLYAIEREGAIQWTPGNGFQTSLESTKNLPSAL